MKYLLLFSLLLFSSLSAFSQNCNYGQCGKIKSDGNQCQRCVGYGQYYCSSHSDTTYSTPTPTYSAPAQSNPYQSSNDCQYSQCAAIKTDGNRCRRCTGSAYSSYCSSHN